MPHTLDTRHRAFIPRQAPGRLSPDGSVAVLRILSVMAGAALGAWGLRRGGPAGVVTALVGIGLLARRPRAAGYAARVKPVEALGDRGARGTARGAW